MSSSRPCSSPVHLAHDTWRAHDMPGIRCRQISDIGKTSHPEPGIFTVFRPPRGLYVTNHSRTPLYDVTQSRAGRAPSEDVQACGPFFESEDSSWHNLVPPSPVPRSS